MSGSWESGYVSAIATTYGIPFGRRLSWKRSPQAIQRCSLFFQNRSRRRISYYIIRFNLPFTSYVKLDLLLGSVRVEFRVGSCANRFYFLFTFVLMGVLFVGVQRLMRSPFGRVMGAVRDDELHARVLENRRFE